MNIIDLRSDTVTKPTAGMLEAMFNANVGDDVFGEDQETNELEDFAAKMFGRQKALFCPSGTMSNQVAIKAHTNPGDEVICDKLSHIYRFEGGGIAFNSGASVRLIEGDRGRFKMTDVVNNINNPDNVHCPMTKLVVVENTSNRGGGSFWNFKDIKEIRKVCSDNNLLLHLDGARIFNALAVTGETPKDYGAIFNSVSICLSKGLGAPVGSVLIGDEEFIRRARRIRKVLGGGMRQSGYMAAAGKYALINHIERMKEDHRRAHELGIIIKKLPYVEEILPVDTNIVIFKLIGSLKDKDFADKMLSHGIKVHAVGNQKVRMVTHLDFTDDMLEKVSKVLPVINF